jgi:biotin carboxyl carrier protein
MEKARKDEPTAMKRIVRIGARSFPVEWTRAGDHITFRLGDGQPAEASILEVEPGVYSVLLGACSFEARVSSLNEEYFVEIRGRHIAVQVIDPRESAFCTRSGAGEGRISVKAPMPGKVVRVLVNAGDEVSAGQGLVVVEAMKMQNELRSPKEGRVVSIDASETESVTAGQVLAVVE